MPARGGSRDSKSCRCFFLGKAGEIAKLDQFGFCRFKHREPLERLVQGQKLLGGWLDLKVRL